MTASIKRGAAVKHRGTGALGIVLARSEMRGWYVVEWSTAGRPIVTEVPSYSLALTVPASWAGKTPDSDRAG